MSTFEEVLSRHCSRAVPIILVDNAIDELSTVSQVLEAVKIDDDGGGHDLLYVWSMSDGLSVAGSTESGQFTSADRYLQDAKKNDLVGGYTFNPAQAMTAIRLIVDEIRAAGKSERAGFVFYMGDRVLNAQDNDSCNKVVQLMMDMRDPLKNVSSCIYMVGIDFNIPKELKEHIVVLQAPLPSEERYAAIVDECYSGYKEAVKGTEYPDYTMSDEDKNQFVESLKGMSSFAAEQTVYLSTDLKYGMSVDEMRQRAIQTINQTRGLSVLRGDGRGFAALGGLGSIKDYAMRLTNGRLKPKLLVLMDEVEKMHSGSSSDTSGVSQNFLGTQLTRMQDSNSLGMLFAGVYGAGKSAFASRWGEEAGVLTIHMDMSGMKDSLVGNSEANLRRALDVIESIGGKDGGIVYLATCNRISQLPPEFKRRFNLGTFFFYFPDENERAAIWDIYLEKYGLAIDSEDVLPHGFDDKWTGAEVESCCRLAYLMKCSIAEAAARIVPVATTAREEIDKLTDEAVGKYLSCSQPGVFTKPARAKTQDKLRASTFK